MRALVVIVLAIGVGLLWGVVFASQTTASGQQVAPPPVSLPLEQSLIVAHYDGSTWILGETLPVGNRAGGGTLQRIAPGLEDVVQGTLYYRGYLQFDVSTVPTYSTVLLAELTLNVDHFEYQDVVPPGEVVSCGLYTVAEPWAGATGPTWNWDDNPAIVSTTNLYAPLPFGQPGVYTLEVTALTQDWINGQANYGLMVGMYPDPDGTGLLTAILHGPAAISETLRPRLSVVYQTPTPTPTFTPSPTSTPTQTPTPTPTPTRGSPIQPPVPTATPVQPDSPPVVPEASTLILLGSAISGLATYIGLQHKARREDQ